MAADEKESEPISPFLDAEKTVKGLQNAGKVPFGQYEHMKTRKVANLCENAPLEPSFASGENQLIPIIFAQK